MALWPCVVFDTDELIGKASNCCCITLGNTIRRKSQYTFQAVAVFLTLIFCQVVWQHISGEVGSFNIALIEIYCCLQCFDTVVWAAGRASSS